MKRSAFEKHAMNKFTTANPNSRSIGELITAAEQNTPMMMQGIETAAALQLEAMEIKTWLTDHPNASPEAIAEQRRRLITILGQIAGTVQS